LLAGSNLFSEAMYQPNLPPLETITVGGVEIHPASLPKQFHNYPDLGIMVNQGMSALRVWAHEPPERWCNASRCIKTPGGDYLLMFAFGRGDYHTPELKKLDDMVAFRSSDQGKTWTGPKVAWNVPYNQHCFVPLVPRGGKRIYAFATEPIFKFLELPEEAPIGFRHSDDDGHTWSDVTIIHPKNEPDFRGFFAMRMCETGNGTWLLAPSVSHYSHQCPEGKTWCRPTCESYIMRSTDHGRTWTLLPHARPNGWFEPKFHRMDEARPISLGGSKVLLLGRTAEGHLWQLRSEDDGQTWSGPSPTPLVHPEAPPMVFHLTDGKALVVFIHNRFTPGLDTGPGDGLTRSELWACISTDEGQTWSEPRFVIANSAGGGTMGAFADFSVSYVDLLVDRGMLHLIISHQFRQVLAIRFEEDLLHRLPTRAELRRLAGQ
jgi:hypothetical protein